MPHEEQRKYMLWLCKSLCLHVYTSTLLHPLSAPSALRHFGNSPTKIRELPSCRHAYAALVTWRIHQYHAPKKNTVPAIMPNSRISNKPSSQTSSPSLVISLKRNVA